MKTKIYSMNYGIDAGHGTVVNCYAEVAATSERIAKKKIIKGVISLLESLDDGEIKLYNKPTDGIFARTFPISKKKKEVIIL